MKICAADAAPGSALEVAFEEFWQAFPRERRRGKGECRDLFARIVAGKVPGRRAKPGEIVEAVRSGYGIDPAFPPMPETWLNQGRWEDEPTEGGDPQPVNGKTWGWWRGIESKLRALSGERWRGAIASATPNGVWPWWVLGAPPEHPECVMPPEIVAEFGYAGRYETNGARREVSQVPIALWSSEEWERQIDQHANGIWPINKLGEPPGHKDCACPAAIVERRRLTEIYNQHGIARRSNH